MVKTTIILEDELYKQLVKEALEKYGSTRKLSLLINQKLKGEVLEKEQKRTTIKIGKKLKPEEIEKLIEKGWEEVIKWRH
ncbi:MAG: hypothetical protein QXY40_03545 [Candidatus Methanomethylicia archaeon]